jgi:hypothetical protein
MTEGTNIVESVNRRKVDLESNLLEGMVVGVVGLMQKGESERVVLEVRGVCNR